MLTAAVRNELERMLGDKVSFSREDLVCYSFDATNKQYLPDAVAFPSSAEDISKILKLANREGIPVIPRGAGTGFTGGSVPIEGGIVVSTEAMRRIIEIDIDNMTAEVEPGVITGDLQDEAGKKGLFYPPDPTSVNFSTIGGNIAECAGGPRGLKYGVTRDYVLGLEVVLPTGEIINTGVKKVLKSVVGYDLTRLLVGSEGTLGIVTKAYLKLLPLPEASITALITYPTFEAAASTVIAIIKSKVLPATLELMDGFSIRCADEHAGLGLKDVQGALLIEADGRRETVERDMKEIEKIARENGALSFKTAIDKNEVKDLWRLRKSISPALNKLKTTKLNEDIAVPRTCLVELVRGLEEISKKRNVLIASFGHAGDGNIHVNIMIDKSNPVEAENGEKAVEDVFALTLRLGGTLSGEHGIGTAKSPYIGMEVGEAALKAMMGIKAALDPNGILNPGKIFPPKKLMKAV